MTREEIEKLKQQDIQRAKDDFKKRGVEVKVIEAEEEKYPKPKSRYHK